MNDQESRKVLPQHKFDIKYNTYILKDCPTALMRPRFKGKNVYDAQSHVKLIKGIELKQQHEPLPPLAGPLHLEAVFYFDVPKSYYKKRAQMIGTAFVNTPDLDNLIKFIKDLMTDCHLVTDDRIIASISARKVYGETARTEFVLMEI